MTEDDLVEMFERNENDQYLKFHLVTNRSTNRSDLYAFNLLDRLRPSITDIIKGANHDEIDLGSAEEWAEYLENYHVITLLRCGVLCHNGRLHMNV